MSPHVLFGMPWVTDQTPSGKSAVPAFGPMRVWIIATVLLALAGCVLLGRSYSLGLGVSCALFLLIGGFLLGSTGPVKKRIAAGLGGVASAALGLLVLYAFMAGDKEGTDVTALFAGLACGLLGACGAWLLLKIAFRRPGP